MGIWPGMGGCLLAVCVAGIGVERLERVLAPFIPHWLFMIVAGLWVWVGTPYTIVLTLVYLYGD